MDVGPKIRVYLTDQLVLTSFGLAAVYWVLDSFLYTFLSYDAGFFQKLTGLNIGGIWTRLIVCCLFVIFGSHAQQTINRRKVAEAELEKMKAVNAKLEQEIAELKTA